MCVIGSLLVHRKYVVVHLSLFVHYFINRRRRHSHLVTSWIALAKRSTFWLVTPAIEILPLRVM